MGLAVIMPVLNEAARIDAQLREVRGVIGGAPIIVVDGGSQDGTVDVVRQHHPQVRLLPASRGRGPQMNAGARAAGDADVLLFLHADVGLPRDTLHWIDEALADRSVVAGAFRTWTVADGATSPRWAALLHLADVRSRYSGLPYGDQALFVRAADFHAVGGYPEQPLMEDVELCRRLRRRGRIRTVPARVRVSGRRFLARPLYYTAAVNLFPLLYRAGVSPATLRRLYRDVR